MGLLDGFLKQLGTGDQVKDYSHASKLFHDGDRRTSNNALYPKLGYLYHVFFELDQDIKRSNTVPDAATEVGMLVKSVELPKFTIDNKTLNSYGRWSIIQSKVKYEPITIQFHDDSADRVRSLWADYYAYYYRDMDHGIDKNSNPSVIYTDKDSRYGEKRDHIYGFTPVTQYDKPKNFIKAIKIYSLHQKRFSEYILVNPIITSFRHGQHEAGKADPMQHEMTVAFEFVLYAEGNIKRNTIPSFGNLHYDKAPSPLTPANGTQSILGPGGLVDTADDVINAIPEDPLGAAFKAYRGFNNASAMDLKQAALGELTQFGVDVLRGNNPFNRIAVPSLSDLSNKIQGKVTSIDDQPDATARGAVTSNGESSVSSANLTRAGVSLIAGIAPVPTAAVGLLVSSRSSAQTVNSDTSTPPAPTEGA